MFMAVRPGSLMAVAESRIENQESKRTGVLILDSGFLILSSWHIPREVHPLASAGERIVFPQGMAFVVFGKLDALEIGVALEFDAEEIPYLALGPRRRLPERRHAVDRRIALRHPRFHPGPDIVFDRVEVVDD